MRSGFPCGSSISRRTGAALPSDHAAANASHSISAAARASKKPPMPHDSGSWDSCSMATQTGPSRTGCHKAEVAVDEDGKQQGLLLGVLQVAQS
jgi:hypothetical protein